MIVLPESVTRTVPVRMLELSNVTGLVPFNTWDSFATEKIFEMEPLGEDEWASTPPVATSRLENACGPSIVTVQLVTMMSAPS